MLDNSLFLSNSNQANGGDSKAHNKSNTESQEWIVGIGGGPHPRRENVVVCGAKRIGPGVASCAHTSAAAGAAVRAAAEESIVRIRDNLVSVVLLVLLMLLEIVK